jgi:hypothetical protein
MHMALSVQNVLTETTPIVPLPPYKLIVPLADFFLFLNLAVSRKGYHF